MMISMIAALAKNRVIGKNNALPWNLPADLKYFRDIIKNKTIIMGLNTFSSITTTLPAKKTIILNKDTNYKVPENCFLATSLEQALDIAKQDDEVMVCGGAS